MPALTTDRCSGRRPCSAVSHVRATVDEPLALVMVKWLALFDVAVMT